MGCLKYTMSYTEHHLELKLLHSTQALPVVVRPTEIH